jgi:hypothetical protein
MAIRLVLLRRFKVLRIILLFWNESVSIVKSENLPRSKQGYFELLNKQQNLSC